MTKFLITGDTDHKLVVVIPTVAFGAPQAAADARALLAFIGFAIPARTLAELEKAVSAAGSLTGAATLAQMSHHDHQPE